MKKYGSLLLVLLMVFSLCACGAADGEGKISQEAFYGEWVSADADETLIINSSELRLETAYSTVTCDWSAPKIVGNCLKNSPAGDLTLVNDGEATRLVGEGISFVLQEATAQ